MFEGTIYNPLSTDRIEKATGNACVVIMPGELAVVFDMGGIGTAPEPQTVTRGETATRPEDPVAEGWVFDGWYTDDSFTTPFDFTVPIMNPVTVYGRWVQTFQISVQKNWPEGSELPQSVEIRYQNRFTAAVNQTGTLTLSAENNWTSSITLTEVSVLTLTEQVPDGFLFGSGVFAGVAEEPIPLASNGNSVTLDVSALTITDAQREALLSGSGILQLNNTKAHIYSAQIEWDIPKTNYKPGSVNVVLQHYNGTAWETVETAELNESNGYSAAFAPILELPGMDETYRIRELDMDGAIVLSSTDNGGSETPTATFRIQPWTDTEMNMDYQVSYAADASGKTTERRYRREREV